VSDWGRAHRLPLEFTCLEIGAHAAEIARERLASARSTVVRLVQEDVFAYEPIEQYDYAVASMCFHHFSDTQILALLRKLRACVVCGVLINDLRRSRLAYAATATLLLGAPSGLRHDALLSIRRGFRTDELKSMLLQLEDVTVNVKPARWFRVAAVIRFGTGGNL
jgi:hypothetical protein